MSDYPFGKCKTRALYCDWAVVEKHNDAQIEVCRYCSRKEIWKLVDGRMADQSKYHEAHIRDFCQPFGSSSKVFATLYPGRWAHHRKSLEAMDKIKRDGEARDEEFRKYVSSAEKTTFL